MEATTYVVIDLETIPTELFEGEETEWADKSAPKKPDGYDFYLKEQDEFKLYKFWEVEFYKPNKRYKNEDLIAEDKDSKWNVFLENLKEYESKYNTALNDYKYTKRPFTLGGSKIITTGLGVIDPFEESITNIQSIFSDIDQTQHTKFIVDYVNKLPGVIKWVGFNIRDFDLPLLSLTFSNTKQELPLRAKLKRYSAIDLKTDAFKFRGGCKKMCKIFGIEQADPNINGAKVRDLYLDGKVTELKRYVEDDILIEAKLALALNRMYSLLD